jgi:hypothetical protein
MELLINQIFCYENFSFIGFAHSEETTHFARFGLGDNIFAHSLANVEMTNVHIMKFFTWM